VEKAIAKARALPAEDQDVLGVVILALAEEELTRIGDLTTKPGLQSARVWIKLDAASLCRRLRSTPSGSALVY
jgi:hypothetical protein